MNRGALRRGMSRLINSFLDKISPRYFSPGKSLALRHYNRCSESDLLTVSGSEKPEYFRAPKVVNTASFFSLGRILLRETRLSDERMNSLLCEIDLNRV